MTCARFPCTPAFRAHLVGTEKLRSFGFDEHSVRRRSLWLLRRYVEAIVHHGVVKRF